MGPQAFEIATLEQQGPRKWLAGGRAYTDISLDDRLTTPRGGSDSLRVVGIVSYGRSTDLLSTMMTGTLTLEGELQVGADHPMFLHTLGN